jgi:flagellar protein FlaJ
MKMTGKKGRNEAEKMPMDATELEQMRKRKEMEQKVSIGDYQVKFVMTKRVKLFLATLGISIVLMIAGYLVSGGEEFIGVMANLIILSTFIIAVPQFFLTYEEYKNIKEMEERFPVMLRDIIESLASGVPLHQALLNASRLDYGKLSVEIKKVANQITWGIPVHKVLNQFANRVKRSKRLFTNIKLINESYTSGGDVVSILNTVADNSNLLEDAEKERRSLLSQYVMLMYAISIIFIIIVVAISRLVMPIFAQPAQGPGQEDLGVMIGLGNPCDPCYEIECLPCGLYQATSYYLFNIDPTSIAAYYIALFFYMSIVQSIFSGLVAGQIGENSMTAGIKHSLIMVSITMGTFFFLIHFNILGM